MWAGFYVLLGAMACSLTWGIPDAGTIGQCQEDALDRSVSSGDSDVNYLYSALLQKATYMHAKASANTSSSAESSSTPLQLFTASPQVLKDRSKALGLLSSQSASSVTSGSSMTKAVQESSNSPGRKGMQRPHSDSISHDKASSAQETSADATHGQVVDVSLTAIQELKTVTPRPIMSSMTIEQFAWSVLLFLLLFGAVLIVMSLCGHAPSGLQERSWMSRLSPSREERMSRDSESSQKSSPGASAVQTFRSQALDKSGGMCGMTCC
jgi:hypothetical protein